jgi:hypothetical protein
MQQPRFEETGQIFFSYEAHTSMNAATNLITSLH